LRRSSIANCCIALQEGLRSSRSCHENGRLGPNPSELG
jgi:hypothetical protein